MTETAAVERTAERAYKTKDAADVKDVSTDMIIRAIHGGKLPAKRVGKGFRILASDLDAWYDSLEDA